MVDAVHKINPDVKIMPQINHGGRQIPIAQLKLNGTTTCVAASTTVVNNAYKIFPKPNT